MTPAGRAEGPARPLKVITDVQVAAILASSIIGVGILTLPRVTTERADTGGPLATALGSLLTMGATALLALLGRRHPDENVFQLGETLFGRAVGKAMALLVVAFFIELTALASREFGEVVVTDVLPRTPLEVTILAMLLLAASAARNDVAVFGRIHEFYLPFIVFPALAIVALALKTARLINLEPFWGQGAAGLARATVLVAALLQTFFVLGTVANHTLHPERLLRPALLGTALAGFVYTAAAATALALFGRGEVVGLLWPTLEMAKAATVPGGIIERFDALFLTVWVTAVFTSLYSTYFVSATGLAQALGLREHKPFALLLLPVVYLLALLPGDIQTLYQTIFRVAEASLPLTFLWPGALLVRSLLAAYRGTDGRRGERWP
ncbi:MAG: endospore germination permease [Clostridia bacterium]|nr:endospore germination permease [Clostridia bacterium]